MNNKQENGFTIVELLAAMVVSSLVVGFVLSLYLFSERIMERRQKDTVVKDAVSSCTQRIIKDIESNSSLVQCDDTSLVLEQNPFKGIKYHFGSSQVWRNGVSIDTRQIELAAHLSFDEDTTSVQPTRLWTVHVTGWQGQFRDSANVHISTMISSQELVSRSMANN